jgi:ribose 5-phosphate isomerase B
MRIAIGSDHAGFRLKELLKEHVASLGHDAEDYGCPDESSVDYPDIARPLAEAVAEGRHDLGVLICSNGVGVSVTANKVPDVRAALCHDTFSARRAREHTDANVLCMGGWSIGEGVARDVLEAFLSAEFQGGRHSRRVDKIRALEERREPVG